jgi:hypothetical protein
VERARDSSKDETSFNTIVGFGPLPVEVFGTPTPSPAATPKPILVTAPRTASGFLLRYDNSGTVYNARFACRLRVGGTETEFCDGTARNGAISASVLAQSISPLWVRVDFPIQNTDYGSRRVDLDCVLDAYGVFQSGVNKGHRE